jgi:glycosyltransferase involved in cell wall biosynthesis
VNSAGASAALTAVVLARDEAQHLPDCLASLSWCDKVLVIDSGSSDGTPELAAAAGARVVQHPFENYSRQRNFALTQVDSPWLLFVDADERVPPDLASEILATLAAPSANGYWLPRRNLFWGHAMRGGGWWPDRQLRLLRVDSAHYDPNRAVHEVADINGPTGSLAAALVHLNYDSPAEMRSKQAEYAALELRRRRAGDWQYRPRQLVTMPLRAFWRRYVQLSGWRDGWTGLVACALMAGYELRVLRGLRHEARPAGGDQAV